MCYKSLSLSVLSMTSFVKQTKYVYGQMDWAFLVDSYPALESHLQIFSMEGPGK